MSNDNSDKKKPGPAGTFKVKLKKAGDDEKYLKSDNNGILSWDSIGTDFARDKDEPNNPSKWTFTPPGGTTMYLTKAARAGRDDLVIWSGTSSGSGWTFSNDKLSSTGANETKYLKYNGDSHSPTLTTNSTTEIVIV